MRRQNLHTGWKLNAVGDLSSVPPELHKREISATVPGCVHTDLLAAGLIEDPYLARNELKCDWIGRSDWRYTLTFSADTQLMNEERIALVFDGLDTIARIELNGRIVGESADMHLRSRFDVKALLRSGGNELSVTFASPLKYAQRKSAEFGDLPHVEKHPFNFIRKMACNFGWDWGPALITSGIWQPVALEGWSVARIKTVRPLVTFADENKAVVDVHVDLDYASADGVMLNAYLTEPGGRTFTAAAMVGEGESGTVLRLEVPHPQLWWPRGYGAQPLYDLKVKLSAGGARDLGEASAKIGIRGVKLNTSPDPIGSQFTLEINGKPVFCKGANWIPDDCFPHRVDEPRYRQRLTQAAAANMNMIRVWGGGIYETDTFYSICDELGLLVWQDFPFACASYPEDNETRAHVEAEARQHVARLSAHASLVLWNGNNENLWGFFDWNWKEKIGDRGWGLTYYLGVLPSVVKELDPTRPYWPGSPFSGSMEIHPLDDRHGNKHIWDAWNQVDYKIYRAYTPRFVSEFGHQAPATFSTLKRAVGAAELKSDSPAMLHHQKAQGGNDKLNARLQEHFAIPSNFDDWLFVTQLNQARAVQTGVEWFRSRQPVCMGALYWQINDCWPVTSWAAIDGDGRPKPLWYATRRFFADRLVTIQPEPNGKLFAYIVNDTNDAWRGQLYVGRINFAWTSGPGGWINVFVPPRSVQQVPLDYYAGSGATEPHGSTRVLTQSHPESELVMAQIGTHRAFWFYDVDKNLKYPAPLYDAVVSVEGTRCRVKVTAKSFLRDLSLFADRLDPDAVVNDQLVTLLPGETFAFEFQSTRQLSKEALTSPPVLQCANRFGASQ